MIRRTKKECGIKLPRKTIVDVPMVKCQQPYAETFKAIVNFQNAGEKALLLKFARFRKLD